MAKFLDYNPDQAYLLPPSVRDVLSSGHLCFFCAGAWWRKLNLSAFRDGYGTEGGPAYAPEMLVFGLVVRLRPGGDQFAAAGAAHSRGYGVSLFGGRSGAGSLDAERFSGDGHARGLNDLFTRRGGGWRGPTDWAAWATWPSTRRAIAANASRNRIDSEPALRSARGARHSAGHLPLAESSANAEDSQRRWRATKWAAK